MVNIVTKWIMNKLLIHSISVYFELTRGGLKWYITQPTFTCLKLTVKTLKKGVKYVQS